MSPSTSAADLCPTGIPGLDTILNGGLPRNRLYLVEGDPGVGKTTLALQFLLEGVRRGESGLYITLSETRNELVAVAKSHGWSVDGFAIFELSAIEEQLRMEGDNTFFHPSEVELNRTTEVLLNAVEQAMPKRLVFDSLSEMRLMAESALRHRRQVLSLKQFLAKRNCTVLLLDDRASDYKDLQVRSLAHGVIQLERKSPQYGASVRSLNVEKVRGVKFLDGSHNFIIEKGGLRVFPRLVAAHHHREFTRESFPTGVAGWDALLQGGLDRGTSSIFLGPPGAGKSTLAILHASVAANRGERVLYFTFDETVGTLVSRAESLNMNLRPSMESGLLRIRQIDPAEISPGELTASIQDAVENEKTTVVVIDSINGYLNALPEQTFLNLQLHELLAYLGQQGVMTIMILAQQGLVGAMQSAVDVSYLADTVVLFRFFEAAGEVRQAVSVIKKRTGPHERTIRQFTINSSGINVGPALSDFQGVLTGSPRFVGDQGEMI